MINKLVISSHGLQKTATDNWSVLNFVTLLEFALRPEIPNVYFVNNTNLTDDNRTKTAGRITHIVL